MDQGTHIYKAWCVLCSDRLWGRYILKRCMTWELLLIHSLLFPHSLVRMFTAYSTCVYFPVQLMNVLNCEHIQLENSAVYMYSLDWMRRTAGAVSIELVSAG